MLGYEIGKGESLVEKHVTNMLIPLVAMRSMS
jgi:hypothetical protein